MNIIPVIPVLVDTETCEEHGFLTIHNKQECIGAGHKAGLFRGGSGEDDWKKNKKAYQLEVTKKDGEPCGCIGTKAGEPLHFNNKTMGQCTTARTCHPGMNCVCASTGIT